MKKDKDEKNKDGMEGMSLLNDPDLDLVSGGIGEEQGPNDEPDGPSLISAGASYEKWVRQ